MKTFLLLLIVPLLSNCTVQVDPYVGYYDYTPNVVVYPSVNYYRPYYRSFDIPYCGYRPYRPYYYGY